MANSITDEMVDSLLERFDQTDPVLQRRIVARLMVDKLIMADALTMASRALGYENAESYLRDLVRVDKLDVDAQFDFLKGHRS
jgi:hypothetical protein